MKVAVETANRAKIAALMLPGLGTMDDIAAAADSACRSSASPLTRLRPIFQSSTSAWRAIWAWRLSASL